MRKTKEDAELTRQRLLEVAFRLFIKNDYDGVSLEDICREANLTRGAAYWHFKNKQDMFESVTMDALNRIHQCTDEQISKVKPKTEEEILVELLWMPNEIPEDFLFVRKAMLYVQDREEFSKLSKVLLDDKKGQYHYFCELIGQIKARNNRLDGISAEELGFIMFYAFEGVYTQDIPNEIAIGISRDMVKSYVRLILG